jgi:hypothetical protein
MPLSSKRAVILLDGEPDERRGPHARRAHRGGQLGFNGAQLTNEDGPALSADRLRVDGNMFCQVGEGGQPFTATGEVRLLGAHIGVQLGFNGAQLTNEKGPALNADGLRVDGDMFCLAAGGQPFTATGEVRLLGAHIGGQLVFDGAQLTNEKGRALNADRLWVDAGMFCQVEESGQVFTATGEVRLLGAHIGGQLVFNGAQLTNEKGPALTADRLRVNEDMFCLAAGGQAFTATGEVRLLGAHIGGQLVFNGAHLNGSPTAINLYEAEVTSLWLHFEERPDGVLDLRRVQTSVINDRTYDESGSWPRTRLAGCRYGSLLASPPIDVETRLRWVRDDPTATRHSPMSSCATSSDVPGTRRTPGVWQSRSSAAGARLSHHQQRSGVTSWTPQWATATAPGARWPPCSQSSASGGLSSRGRRGITSQLSRRSGRSSSRGCTRSSRATGRQSRARDCLGAHGAAL